MLVFQNGPVFLLLRKLYSELALSLSSSLSAHKKKCAPLLNHVRIGSASHIKSVQMTLFNFFPIVLTCLLLGNVLLNQHGDCDAISENVF